MTKPKNIIEMEKKFDKFFEEREYMIKYIKDILDVLKKKPNPGDTVAIEALKTMITKLKYFKRKNIRNE